MSEEQDISALRPEAVLFDFGGGLFDCVHDDTGHDLLAEHVQGLLERAGCRQVSVAEIGAAVRDAAQEYSRWKSDRSDDPTPREVSPREYWSWVSRDWPAAAQRAVDVDAQDLCRRLERLAIMRIPKLGIRDALRLLADRGVPAAVVSNALAGQTSRELMREHDLERLVGPQLYSNELGIRKPNPEIARLACEAVGVPPERAWLVGDSPDRDVRCGHRAGIGRIVLIPSGPLPELRGEDRPHVIAETGVELLAMLEKALG